MDLKHLQEQIDDIIKKQNKVDNGAKVDYKARTKGYVYQLKVSFKRRILVQDNITLYGLHQIIQAVMGWADIIYMNFKWGRSCLNWWTRKTGGVHSSMKSMKPDSTAGECAYKRRPEA